MRRLVVLIVLALVGAGVYGLTSSNAAVTVNSNQVSNDAFLSELHAIATTPNIECYLDALAQTAFVAGAGSETISANSADAWSNLRIQGLAVSDYVTKTFHYQPNAKALATARSSLEGELTQAATSAQYSCPGTSTEALNAMPAEMRSAEVFDQAMSTYFLSRLDTTIPLTLAAANTYYQSHVSSYDTLCVSIALMSPTSVAAFDDAEAAGDSVATLAAKFSLESNAKSGGADGCFSPSSTYYESIRSDVGTTALNTFPRDPQYVTIQGAEYALFVAPTKRTVTPFTSAEATVLNDIRSYNAAQSNAEEENILYATAVAVNPAFGRWGLSSSSSGPSVFAPLLPSSSDALDTSKNLTTASTTKYK